MLTLRVLSVKWEAEDILSFELVDPSGRDLPIVKAGAHIDVHIPGGHARRYSLCDPPWDRRCWRIAVLNEPNSRGGSRAMHTVVRAGQLLDIEGPHNFFPLAAAAAHSVLLAGGIGITPVLSMAEQLERDQQSWELHYCTRSAERTAFTERLRRFGSKVRIHHDGGDPSRGLDIEALLRTQRDGANLYYCGPAGFMKAVQQASSHWSEGSVHFEWFGAAPTSPDSGVTEGQVGSIELRRSARFIEVAQGQTVLQALRAAGVECESSCEAGMCRACELRYLEGDPIHGDLVLGEDERRDSLLICCAKVGRAPLVLDI